MGDSEIQNKFFLIFNFGFNHGFAFAAVTREKARQNLLLGLTNTNQTPFQIIIEKGANFFSIHHKTSMIFPPFFANTNTKSGFCSFVFKLFLSLSNYLTALPVLSTNHVISSKVFLGLSTFTP